MTPGLIKLDCKYSATQIERLFLPTAACLGIACAISDREADQKSSDGCTRAVNNGTPKTESSNVSDVIASLRSVTCLVVSGPC